MLKAVKHLSMNATLLEVLQNANALEILIRLLDEQGSGSYNAASIFTHPNSLCRTYSVDRRFLITSSKHVITSAG
jgi:hypothetical protein